MGTESSWAHRTPAGAAQAGPRAAWGEGLHATAASLKQGLRGVHEGLLIPKPCPRPCFQNVSQKKILEVPGGRRPTNNKHDESINTKRRPEPGNVPILSADARMHMRAQRRAHRRARAHARRDARVHMRAQRRAHGRAHRDAHTDARARTCAQRRAQRRARRPGAPLLQ